MHSHKVEGIIIKRNNFSEADRILTIFTRSNGKMKIKAKGVRKISSRRASHIELLNFSILSLHQSPRMQILTEAETIDPFEDIKNNLMKVGFAYHVCELVNELCAEHQENRQVFSLILDTFEKIRKEENPRVSIREFEVELLSLLGFWNRQHDSDNIHAVIESLMEKKLKTKRILPLFEYPL